MFCDILGRLIVFRDKIVTIKRYFDEPLGLEFTATVIEATLNDDGTSNIILAETYFYPGGGGQSQDKGTLGTKQIVDIRKEGETIIHVIDGEPQTGEISAKVDKAYRHRNMSAHTGQHILSAALLQELEAETVAVKMNSEGLSTVDVSLAEINPEQIIRVENLANTVIRENREIKSYFVVPDSPRLKLLRRAVKFDKVTGDVRLVEIDKFDLSACAGTHFPQTGMCGLLKIFKVENYKGGSRIHFAAGEEALKQFQQYHRILESVSGLLSSGINQVYELVEKLQTERSDLSKQVAEQKEKLLTYEVQELLAQKSDNGIIKLVFENYASDDLRIMANHLRDGNNTRVAIVNKSGDDVMLIIATSDDNPLHAGDTLREILAEFDGRGGGRENYAQGVLKGFDDTESLVLTIDKHLE